MAVKREEAATAEQDAVCKCGVTAMQAFGKKDGPIVHCSGAADVFRVVNRAVHHGRHFWHCPRCRRTVGCDTCAGNRPESIICEPCQTFVNGDVVIGSGLEQLYVEFKRIKRSQFRPGIEASQPNGDR